MALTLKARFFNMKNTSASPYETSLLTNEKWEPKISLIVAIYKSAPFLNQLITSLLCQTYKNIEIILVDDGSPDESGKICDAFSKKDSRIKVIHKENGGVCEARNRGLDEATGDYVMIIDGDDWLESDCVEYMLNLIYVTKSEMAFSDKLFTTRDRKQTTDDCIETWSPDYAAAMIIYPHMFLGPWNKIYKMDLLKRNSIKFPKLWFGEGLYFASTAAQYANHVGVGHRKVYNYRLNNLNSGLTNYRVKNGLNARENINLIKSQLHIKSKILVNAVDWHILKNHEFLLLQIIGSKQKNDYIKEYRECVSYIRKNFVRVLIKSDVSLKERLKIMLCGINPVLYNKLVIEKKKRELQKDLARLSVV